MMRELSCHKLSFARPATGKGTLGILDRIDCMFPSGTLSVISGAVGAGKSTLVHILGGLLRPTSGEVRVDGAPVSRWVSGHRDLWRRNVGIVFQNPRILDNLTAFENVLLPLIVRHRNIKEIRSAGSAALGRLDAAHLAARPAGKLSGGERQKVAIARAICTTPALLLADEPTAHQDDRSAERILDLFAGHARNGHIVIVVAHDRRALADHADRHFLMMNGRLERIR